MMRHVRHPEELIPTTIVRDQYFQKKKVARFMKGKTVADIGSGTGFFTQKFADHASSICAMDCSVSNVRIGHQLNGKHNAFYVNGDAHAIPFRTGSVDVVFCTAMIEHIEDPMVFYSEVYRILKPRGIVIQSIDIRPKLSVWLYRVTFLFDRFYPQEHPMIHKDTQISDERCEKFISPLKLKHLVADKFHIVAEEKFAGLNFNLIHGCLVLVNKLQQWLSGDISSEGNYADQLKKMDRPLFRAYRRCLPLIERFLNPMLCTWDGIYYYMLLRRKPF
jgi:ubiquinone/menaquinone biosynthesis C-methylase UbiE